MATVPAILGTARLGNFRLGYRSAAMAAIRRTRARILINGSDRRATTEMAGVTVHDVINEAPNTAALTVNTTAPTVQQSVRISVNSDAPVLLFDGTLQTVGSSYLGKPLAGRATVFPCTAIDDGARAKRRRPFGTWTNVSATTIAQYLRTTYMPGFTGNHIQAALPAISLNLDGSEGIDGAFTQIAKLIGGYWYVEDLDVYLFNDAATIGLSLPDDINSTPGRFLDDPPIRITRDDSQLVTRYFGKGHGEQILSDVGAGETVVPVSNAAAWFGTLGPGKAITDTQRLAYTGVQTGGIGSLVGPGVTPSAPPSAVAASGSGIESGAHSYAVLWGTAAGKTLVSPIASVTLGVATDPTSGPTLAADTSTWTESAGLAIGDTVQVGVQYAYDYGFTVAVTAVVDGASVVVPAWSGGGHPAVMRYAFSATAPAFCQHARVVWQKNGGGYQVQGGPEWVGSPGSAIGISGTVHSTGAGPAGANRNMLQATIDSIAVGPTGTTYRELHRTAAGASQLQLLHTFSDNTTTGPYTDSAADATLGANAPTSDTSGLTQPTGQVNAGATSIITAGAAFPTSGWAVLAPGTQVVKYTGISGNTLTGIPASGPGSIVAAIAYNSTITAAPLLTGVTGIVVDLVKGAPINIWVQRDDLAAQADAATRDNDGGDGVYEAPPIVDERRGEASLIAICDANLTLYSRPLVTVVYATRDMKTKSGLPVVFNLTTPAISDTLTIQEATITEIDIASGLAPKYLVTASSVRFSLESLLQKMAANL